jgi:hypothetical protein
MLFPVQLLIRDNPQVLHWHGNTKAFLVQCVLPSLLPSFSSRRT